MDFGLAHDDSVQERTAVGAARSSGAACAASVYMYKWTRTGSLGRLADHEYASAPTRTRPHAASSTLAVVRTLALPTMGTRVADSNSVLVSRASIGIAREPTRSPARVVCCGRVGLFCRPFC